MLLQMSTGEVVAFLGTGKMGAPMALHVARHGHRLRLWNRTRDRAEAVATRARAERGPGAAPSALVEVADDPRGAARGAAVVLLMLADPAAVDAVLAGPQGVLEGLSPGAIVVDLSTVDPATARRSHASVTSRGGRYLDCPVSGTVKPAMDGTLVLMAGGEVADVEAARPVLETMGQLRHVGPVGHGMSMKLVLNGLGAHMLTGLVSMLELGRRMGLDHRSMIDGIMAGAFSSPLYASKGARIVARDFRPDFTLALMLKDQRLVLEAADRAGLSLPSEQAIADVLASAVATGLGEEDLCGLIRWFEGDAARTAR